MVGHHRHGTSRHAEHDPPCPKDDSKEADPKNISEKCLMCQNGLLVPL